MLPADLKLIMVPWGADTGGEEVWLLENALVLGVESVFEQMGIPYADLYDQLGGGNKRTAIVPPYQESELLLLASKAPPDTVASVDGLIKVVLDQDSGALVEVEIAPRILQIPLQNFHHPDAFRFQGFANSDSRSDWFEMAGQDEWHALIIMIAETILEPFSISVPSHIGPETVAMTSSWPAYRAFIKGKRGSKTAEEKLGYYRQATRLDPKFFWARFNAGQLHKQQQDYHSARREFLAAVEGARDDPSRLGDVYFELGLCSIFLGDTKTARNFWDQALTFAPNNPVLLVNVAGTFEQEEDWHRAITLHQMALDIDPNYYKAVVSLGRLKAQTGNIKEAIVLYERALVIKPDDPLRYAILGGCYLSEGDESKAVEYFERASELDPPKARRDIRIDEDDSPPPPGEYARQELATLASARAKRNKAEKGGWHWFGR